MKTRRAITWLVGLIAAIYAATQATAAAQHPLSNGKQPNIVFILTDDQDLHMDSLSYMPNLNKHVTSKGTFFHRHFCTVALCCPSRASMWAGKAAHNTNVTDLNPPYGGYPKFVDGGFNDNYLPIWLQEAGYNTYYIGKFLNGQRVTNYDKPFAKGWTGSEFLLDPFTYEYLNATFQRNHDPPVSYEGQYLTDVLANKSYGFLDDAIESDKPFLLTIAPIAPHSNVHIYDKYIDGNYSGTSAQQAPPVPAERHKHLFNEVVVPRTPHFNPIEPNGVAWISQLPHQNQTNVDYNDDWYRNRLRALQAVDEMIDEVVRRLEHAGIIDDTYIVFSTDNGYHVGQHRLQPGKQCAYEEDINIPFIVRGPGVSKRAESDIVTSHTDIAPTFLSLANADLREDYLDGSVIPLHQHRQLDHYSTRHEHVNIEMWGIIMSEGKYEMVLHHNHTYKAIRIIGQGYNLLYTVWCSGEHELYDLSNDPYEMDNLYTDDTTPSRPTTAVPGKEPISVDLLISRLDTLLIVLKTCVARSCTHPWEVIHPDGKVHTLRDALNPRYDKFYAAQSMVYWTKCEEGYIAESEGPSSVVPFMLFEAS
ncbi:arylsulfatase [Polychaeton citri CBS 116435]|uniref:Arylsulfatase n=1 Tax=Polychaeton citri CBS 116435 TaxID=1314669 RepID=A0A9P4UNZ8_9PEZI|nr:arylsulfatase [Polychaeton citri CBS 116435]